MKHGRPGRGWLREVIFPLALLALGLQLLVPPGYMVGGHDGGPTRIVICTGHGPVNAAIDLGNLAPARGKKSDAPCAFAGHAAPANLGPAGPALAVAWKGFELVHAIPPDQVYVGRGLAAPPPARGPPVFLS